MNRLRKISQNDINRRPLGQPIKGCEKAFRPGSIPNSAGKPPLDCEQLEIGVAKVQELDGATISDPGMQKLVNKRFGMVPKGIPDGTTLFESRWELDVKCRGTESQLLELLDQNYEGKGSELYALFDQTCQVFNKKHANHMILEKLAKSIEFLVFFKPRFPNVLIQKFLISLTCKNHRYEQTAKVVEAANISLNELKNSDSEVLRNYANLFQVQVIKDESNPQDNEDDIIRQVNLNLKFGEKSYQEGERWPQVAAWAENSVYYKTFEELMKQADDMAMEKFSDGQEEVYPSFEFCFPTINEE